MAPGWCNMVKRYWTVPLLILTCLTGPTSTQEYWEGLPTFCSPIEETTVIQQLPEFEYRGCYADQSNPRLLPIGANSTGSMTVTTCASICSSQGYAFFGVEYSYQCWCGNALHPRAVPADQSNCNYACCADSSSVACGGDGFIGVYEARPSPTQTANSTNNSGSSPMQVPNVTNYSGNHSNNATYDGDNSSSDTSNDGGSNYQTSNKITLGTSIGIGVPGLILSALLVKMKFSKRGRNPRQGTSQPSPKASSTHGRYTESISTI
ncbi:hypothetical protein JMJ35_010359 [Cladonia borealis]|uniref:WSC domain-containing protein n=1 Tax=Cladonia borealis TaxID=184061 RepID=A0AA39QSY9_9LECA|nr:hypothetical protein JMJ35_010359 [Cladonia borealis]